MIIVTSEFKGLDKLQKNLKNLKTSESVPISELFNSTFMRKYTNYQTFDSMLSAFGIQELKDISELDNKEWNQFVKEHSKFIDWDDMKGTAGTERISRKLGF